MAGLFTWEREDAFQEGIPRGIQLGYQKVIRRQLTRRFGPLPPWATQRIEEAPAEQLEEWLDRVLDAKTLEEVIH